ncbi:MAG: zinc ribbon domain-containing protein [Deltaproteobacteria bacterium]|nr:zinc ribbon domain-containing protein [Deltaproteobacteria bacterium]
MPIYEYRCENCQHEFEKLMFQGDEERIRCPECGETKTTRVLSATSFMSGSGLGACVSGSSSGFS